MRLAVEEPQKALGRNGTEEAAEERRARHPAGRETAQQDRVHGKVAGGVGGGRNGCAVVVDGGRDGAGLALDRRERVARGGADRPTSRADPEDVTPGTGSVAGIGQGDDTLFPGEDIVGSEAEHVLGVLTQRGLVGLLRQDGRAELRVLDQRLAGTRGQYVAEGQAVPGLWCTEVHQLHDVRLEDGPLRTDEPSAEVLEKCGSGGRGRGRTGVEDPARPHGHRGAAGRTADECGAVVPVLDPFHDSFDSGQGGEARAQALFEEGRAQHLVAEPPQASGGGGAVGSPHPKVVPGGGHQVVVLSRSVFPVAPGAFGRPQGAGRGVDKDHRGGGDTSGRAEQTPGERQSGRAGTDDSHVAL